MKSGWRARAQEILEKTRSVSLYPELEADFKETLFGVYKIIGAEECFPACDEFFSVYWDRAIHGRFRQMKKYGAQFSPGEFRNKVYAIKFVVERWSKHPDNNGSGDRSVELNNMLYRIPSSSLPEADRDSAIFPDGCPSAGTKTTISTLSCERISPVP